MPRSGIANTNNDITVSTGAAVGGTSADADPNSGNPVLVGGEYNATPPTYTDGDRANLQQDVNGYLKVNVAAGVPTDTAI